MDISAIALGGLNRAQSNFENAAKKIAGAGGSDSGSTPVDTVSLSSDMVSLISAKNDFAANIASLKVADQMQKSTLDILG